MGIMRIFPPVVNIDRAVRMKNNGVVATHAYEVEIKSLLGSKERADALRERMRERDAGLLCHGAHAQKNHYFIGGNIRELCSRILPHIAPERRDALRDIAAHAKDFSARTRWADGMVLVVLKVSMDDAAARLRGAASDRRDNTTSANGTARLEFEAETPGLTLEALDDLLLQSGFTCQAKWSREREEYTFLGANVTIDKNAGYGYVAEFERVIDDATKAEATKAELRALLADLGIAELPPDRLERMFAHYNAHWPEYYGTDKVFVIE